MRLRHLLALTAALALVFPVTASAAEVTRTFDFSLEDWHEIEATDGLVTLHRLRLERKEGRVTKAAICRPYNSEYLETIQIQLEYTNGSSQNWDSRIETRWLDEEGRVIDGFSANEGLDKKSARKVARMSVPTSKYGLERAKTLEVTIHFKP